MRKNLIKMDESEVYIVVGQLILYYQYYKLPDDNKSNWFVGAVNCNEEEEYFNSKIILDRSGKAKNIDIARIGIKKVYSNKIAQAIVKKLRSKGFKPDKIIKNLIISEKTTNIFQVFIYRNYYLSP